MKKSLLVMLWSGLSLTWACNCFAGFPAYEPDWAVIKPILQSSKPVNWKDEKGKSVAYYHLRFGSTLEAEKAINKATLRGVRLPDADDLLRQAIELRAEQVVAALLKNGASPHGDPALTPLMLAASLGHLHIMQILLNAGADPLTRHTAGPDAVEYAVWNGRYLLLHLLRDNGLDFKKYLQKRKHSPLFDAIDGDSFSVFTFLVGYADLDAKNQDGETPLAYAKRIGKSDLAEIIKTYMEIRRP